MDRRRFLHLGALGGAASIMLPTRVLAGSVSPTAAPLAGSVYYTADAPGRWSGKQAGHVPLIEISGSRVQVATAHGMEGYEHYIVKHVLLDEHLGFVGETLFNPETDSPISEYDLANLENRIFAVSLCNKHDAWLSVLEL